MRKRAMWAAIVLASTGALGLATAPLAAAQPVFTTMNAAGGIYWRSAPNWNAPEASPGNGFYNGEEIAVQCYQSGTTVPAGFSHGTTGQGVAPAGHLATAATRTVT